MASIEVRRRNEVRTDRARKYKVLVDGEEVGRIRAGETVVAEVAPGEHEVSVRLDWCRSRPLTVHADDGETTVLECRPNAGPFTILWYISFGMRNYIDLAPAAPTEPPPPS